MGKLPKSYTRKIWRAIVEFELLKPGDRVLVGLSGGKDSSFLLYALKYIKQQAPFEFDLGALTVDMGFRQGFDTDKLQAFCSQLGIPFYLLTTKFSGVIEGNGKKGACAKCAFLRRGAMNMFAREEGYNKIALAHHYDDAVETFLMSQLYAGQLKTFMPRSYLARSGITVIRPLIYMRESEVSRAREYTGFEPIPSPCPYDGHTKRQEVKELIAQLSTSDNNVFTNLAAAMRSGDHLELWPEKISNSEIKDKNEKIWYKE